MTESKFKELHRFLYPLVELLPDGPENFKTRIDRLVIELNDIEIVTYRKDDQTRFSVVHFEPIQEATDDDPPDVQEREICDTTRPEEAARKAVEFIFGVLVNNRISNVSWEMLDESDPFSVVRALEATR